MGRAIWTESVWIERGDLIKVPSKSVQKLYLPYTFWDDLTKVPPNHPFLFGQILSNNFY